MRSCSHHLVLTLCILLSSSLASANQNYAYDIPQQRSLIDLVTAFSDALKNDPTYQQQFAAYLSSAQATPQAIAVLLPQISLSATLSGARQTSTVTGLRKYNSDSYGAELSQAVFNANAFLTLGQAKYSVRAAAMQLSFDLQSLIIRVSNAYLNVLQAQDLLRYTSEQRIFLARTLAVSQERFRLKHATITDLEFARGSYQIIQSEYIEAKVNLYNSIQQLSQITGVRYKKFAHLKSRLPLISPNPAKLQDWIKSATMHNLSINAARFELQAARYNVGATAGNFLPIVNAVGTWDDVNGTTGGFFSRKQILRTGTIGLNTNWNIFQGGLTISQVKQASALSQQAHGLLRQRYLDSIASTRIAYTGIVQGRKQTYHSHLAVKAYLKSVENGEQAYQSGVISIYDILQSQTRLYAAEQRYVRDLYAYLLNTLQLKQAAGTLAPSSIAALNRYLTPHARKPKMIKKAFKFFKTKASPKHKDKPVPAIHLPYPTQTLRRINHNKQKLATHLSNPAQKKQLNSIKSSNFRVSNYLKSIIKQEVSATLPTPVESYTPNHA